MARKKHRGGFFRKILFYLLLVIASLTYFTKDDNRWDAQDNDGGNTQSDIVKEIETQEDFDTEYEGRRMYQQLTEEEQGIYRSIQKNLAHMQETCTIERISGTYELAKDKLVRAIHAVYFDYPEYFWFNQSGRWEYSSHDGYIRVDLKLCSYEYWNYVLDKKAYVDKVEQKAQEIANLAKQFDSTFERVKFVHDYLVTHAEYDYVALEECNQTVQKASSQQSHSVYGCLVNQRSVCDGYAKSFQMIMNLLDVDCEYIEGDAGGPHAWNYIVLDDENYWMDVTWDDHNLRDEDGNIAYPYGVEYAYFCVTSDTLYDTHTPGGIFVIPECNAVEYNFFHHENSYLETYSFEALAAGVEEQKDAQIISLKFGSPDALDQALQDLFGENRRYRDLPYIGNREMRYSNNNTTCILSFYLD